MKVWTASRARQCAGTPALFPQLIPDSRLGVAAKAERHGAGGGTRPGTVAPCPHHVTMTSVEEPKPYDRRVSRPPLADERTTLAAFLEWHRLTLEVKCHGLSPHDLARRSVERSTLTLLGLVRHMAEGERYWFRQVMAGENPTTLFPETGQDAAFEVSGAGMELVAAAWKAWRFEVAFAEAFVSSAPNLDVVGDEPGAGPVSLRWVLVHMIEEYARHNGHADLIRQQIDGAVGI